MSSDPASNNIGDDIRDRLSKGKDVYIEHREIKEDLDFTAIAPTYTATPGARRAVVSGAVTFVKCQFKGKVTGYRSDPTGTENTATFFAKNITFIECTFEEEVNLRACTVNDLVCFTNCFFLKKAIFEEGDFKDNAIFSKSQFKGEARFQNIFFRKKADFLRTEFFERVNFQGAAFALDAQFSSAKSYKSVDFATVQFNGHTFFNYADLQGQAVFDDAWFKGRCEFCKQNSIQQFLRIVGFIVPPF
ncbi:MAG: pentapeptide repeat-containing protein [Saprospiraceae bacterium]|nr:pentapeptide repeat-containing protein [Saprospiraceae bacterium]